MFVSRPRQVITREAIHQELWTSDVHVDFEQGVNHTIKQLRAALGDDAEAPRYIETLTRRGYRFIAPIDVVPSVENNAPAAPAPLPRLWRRLTDLRVVPIAAGVLAVAAVVMLLARTRDPVAALPPNSTLAVMPFEIVNVPGETGYLGLSLADAVIARLANGGAIRVRPVTPPRTADGSAQDVRAAGRTLQVDYVLAGSVHRIGGRDRVQLQLLHAATAREV